MNVNISHETDGGNQFTASENRQGSTKSVRPGEHYSCGVIGLLFAGVLTVALYLLFVSIAMPLGMFATTVLISIFALAWGVEWIGAELLWEWNTGRLLSL